MKHFTVHISISELMLVDQFGFVMLLFAAALSLTRKYCYQS
jgi:hypothetical protein